jgi:hypothetical protein
MSVSGLAKVVALSDNAIVKKFTGVRCRLERSGGLHSAHSVEGRFRPLSDLRAFCSEWLLSKESQKPSTTAWVLNRVCGSVKIRDLWAFQKRAFLGQFCGPTNATYVERHDRPMADNKINRLDELLR